MWRELIDELYPGAELPAPADEATIAEIEKALSLPLPFELGSLLGECNGVYNQYGDAVVWSAERLIEDNLAMRREPDALELYAPFDELIFFGDSDMGPQFAYVHTDYGPGIIVWDQETDHRRLAVVSLRDYLIRCLTQGNAWFRSAWAPLGP
ncbi:SMI1/KNR4 family protein [Halostreptopolyspora alba]|uniref:SMI1/KNR4 family protein n=1 Tax=Halostreptopolyspora alba TaxID=2487137 RepID=A0A3N0EGK3_9ACTN|nr:SMI1/KNR4 family protein [Nocardiopsaceae bacterium YIM 96095]